MTSEDAEKLERLCKKNPLLRRVKGIENMTSEDLEKLAQLQEHNQRLIDLSCAALMRVIKAGRPELFKDADPS